MCYFIPYFMRHFSYHKIKKYIYLPLLARFAYFLILLLVVHFLLTFLLIAACSSNGYFTITFYIFNDTIKVTA